MKVLEIKRVNFGCVGSDSTFQNDGVVNSTILNIRGCRIAHEGTIIGACQTYALKMSQDIFLDR
jgi:hypothetical protein